MFILSYLSMALVSLMRFVRQELEHFLCSYHCINLSSPWRFGRVKVCKLVTLGFFEP
jgi:hypothetical protein